MRLTKSKCPNCGADLKIEENQKKIKCDYCHQTILIDDADLTIKHKITGNLSVDGIQTDDALLESANELMDMNEYLKAKKKFLEYTEKCPDDYRGWLGLLICRTRNFRIKDNNILFENDVKNYYSHFKRTATPKATNEYDEDIRRYLYPEEFKKIQMECPNCHKKYDGTSRHCTKCGEKLVKASDIAIGSATMGLLGGNKKQVKCPHCDSKNYDGALYCTSCGRSMKQIKENSKNEEKSLVADNQPVAEESKTFVEEMGPNVIKKKPVPKWLIILIPICYFVCAISMIANELSGIAALLFIVGGVFTLPPVWNRIKIKKGLKITIAVVIFSIAMIAFAVSQDMIADGTWINDETQVSVVIKDGSIQVFDHNTLKDNGTFTITSSSSSHNSEGELLYELTLDTENKIYTKIIYKHLSKSKEKLCAYKNDELIRCFRYKETN